MCVRVMSTAMTAISTAGNDNATDECFHELIIAVPKRASIHRMYPTTGLPYSQYIFVGFSYYSIFIYSVK